MPVYKSVTLQWRINLATHTWYFTGKLLEGLALGLRDQKRGEDAQKHEKCEDFHDVV